MKSLLSLATAALCFSASPVQADPFAQGDAKKGQALVSASCTACHVSIFGGDGSKVYVRPDRKVHNANQLASRIQSCNVNSGAGWFPEEEQHAAVFLNQTFYKFK